MSIVYANAGSQVQIKKITGDEKVRQHLAELGFVAGETVTVINEIAGSLILQVKDSRIAVNRSMANRIEI